MSCHKIDKCIHKTPNTGVGCEEYSNWNSTQHDKTICRHNFTQERILEIEDDLMA